MVEVGLVVLLSVGLPMSMVALLAIIGFKINGRGSRNCFYRSSPKGSFEKLSNNLQRK